MSKPIYPSNKHYKPRFLNSKGIYVKPKLKIYANKPLVIPKSWISYPPMATRNNWFQLSFKKNKVAKNKVGSSKFII